MKIKLYDLIMEDKCLLVFLSQFNFMCIVVLCLTHMLDT